MGCPWGDAAVIMLVGGGWAAAWGNYRPEDGLGGRVRAQEPADEGGATLLDLAAVQGGLLGQLWLLSVDRN